MSKVTITTADLERLLKMSLRYALPSNGSSPSVVADLFKEHIGELRIEFIEWARILIQEGSANDTLSKLHIDTWNWFDDFLLNTIINRYSHTNEG